MAAVHARSFSEILLATKGQLGRLIAEHDWSRTPLGPIEGWPQSLKTTLSLVLVSPAPMAVL